MSQVAIVAGLGYGDEGKGTITELFVRNFDANIVVRYNGGPQAGHTVVLQDGRRHIFSQFGSGTFSEAATYLSKYMLINPLNMLVEAQALKKLGVGDPMSLMSVSPDCLVITPFHVYANRIREELRGDHKNGSCGMGIGETVYKNLIRPELSFLCSEMEDAVLCEDKLRQVQHMFSEEFEGVSSKHMDMILDKSLPKMIAKQYAEWYPQVIVVDDEYAIEKSLKAGNVVFEGAQGVLLDEDLGFPPHNTWTCTTFKNALELLKPHRSQDVSKIGVLRAYSHRHGAGPLITEDRAFECLPSDGTNQPNPWQGTFRRGYFDLVLAKYAIEVTGGCEELVITHMDQAEQIPEFRVCSSYSISGRISDSLLKWAKPVLEDVDLETFPEYLIEHLETMVRITSHGPTFEDKIITE